MTDLDARLLDSVYLADEGTLDTVLYMGSVRYVYSTETAAPYRDDDGYFAFNRFLGDYGQSMLDHYYEVKP